MRLASNLIEVGMPWLANLLPADKIYRRSGNTSKSADDFRTSPPEEIPFNEDVNAQSIQAAKNDLNEITESITWRMNYEMFSDTSFDITKGEPLQWQGITRLVDSGPSRPGEPWELTHHEDILAVDEISQEEGKDRRPLVIGTMGEVRIPLDLSESILPGLFEWTIVVDRVAQRYSSDKY
jgi:hypothetical protein